MRSFAVCILLVAAAVSLASAHIPPGSVPGAVPQEPRCPPMWYRSGKSCLRFINTPANWNDANDFCSRFSSCATGNPSFLMKIRSAAEESLLNSFLTSLAELSPPDTWIGLNDKQIEGQYVWADGTLGPRTAFEYKNFAIGEPNDSSQLTGLPADCFMRSGQMGTWRDEACAQQMAYVCEMDLQEPATPGTGGVGGRGV